MIGLWNEIKVHVSLYPTFSLALLLLLKLYFNLYETMK